MPLKPLKTKDRLNAVKMNAVAAYSYCRDVLERRWPEAEPYILKDAWHSVFYARDIMKAPWPAAEPEIMKWGVTAYVYATEVLNRRWKAAEPVIKQDEGNWYSYKQYFNIK